MAAAQSGSGGAELNLGAEAFRHAKYEEAIRHFEKAVAQNPANGIAHLYLATAYAQQYVPGADTTENNQMGDRAIEHYQKSIELDSSKSGNLNAVKGIAYLELQMKRFDEAKENYRKATELDPQDPEAYYSIAVIDWTQAYQPRMEERMKLGLKPDASLPAKDPNVCDILRTKNWDKVQEGIDNLIKAIQLRPDYEDAMAYLNLMYRERADLQCFDPEARKVDLKNADEWVDKTMATRKAKAEKEDSLRPAPNQ